MKFFLVAILVSGILSCNKNITDLGLDGQFSGTLKNEAGKVIPSDIMSNAIIVNALGEGDVSTTILRVKGDGTYQYTKLFPKKYKVWLSGPVTPVGFDTLRLDFSAQKVQKTDLTVKPFVYATVSSGTVAAGSINVNYTFESDGIRNINTRAIYCSTVSYPTGTTGSGSGYNTYTFTATANEGTATFTGLTSGRKYFIRAGASTVGNNLMNYSEQIIIVVP